MKQKCDKCDCVEFEPSKDDFICVCGHDKLGHKDNPVVNKAIIKNALDDIWSDAFQMKIKAERMLENVRRMRGELE